jgi:hypothetical protein
MSDRFGPISQNLGSGSFMIKVVEAVGERMSNRERHFGPVGDGESGSMPGFAGMGSARNQSLGVQATEIYKLLESLELWLII